MCPPLHEDELAAYNLRQEGCITISCENFRMDFTRDRSIPFNLEAEFEFAINFRHRVLIDKWYSFPPIPDRFMTEEYIIFCLHNHVKYVREKYKEYVVDNSRNTYQKLQLAARSSRKSRVSWSLISIYSPIIIIGPFKLFRDRCSVLSFNPSLANHSKLMRTMGVNGVSSDESDNEDDYIRVSPGWRSEQLAQFLWSLDEEIARHRTAKVGQRRRRGNKARRRVFSALVNNDTLGPPGLPRNCYDEDWLNNLRPHERRLIRLKDYDHVFFGNDRDDAANVDVDDEMRVIAEALQEFDGDDLLEEVEAARS
jgi:hypothetical protein